MQSGERRLEETLVRIPPLEKAVMKQNEMIAELKNQLALTMHALDIANSRIWQPGCRVPDEQDRSHTMLHGAPPPRAAGTSTLDEVDFARPVRNALLRSVRDEAELRGKSHAELVALLLDSGVLDDLAEQVGESMELA